MRSQRTPQAVAQRARIVLMTGDGVLPGAIANESACRSQRSASGAHGTPSAADPPGQANTLERTQPVLPMGLGYVEGVTHDYVRLGTITLFAALDVANGQVISRVRAQPRHQEFLDFLRQIDKQTPIRTGPAPDRRQQRDPQAHKVKAWLARNPRFHIHFTPTYSSWLNQVERWFAPITERAITATPIQSFRRSSGSRNVFLRQDTNRTSPIGARCTTPRGPARIYRTRMSKPTICFSIAVFANGFLSRTEV